MATTQSITPQTTIDAAEDTILVLSALIFKAKNLLNVETQISDASKIRFGLKAVNDLEVTDNAYMQIIVGLHPICKIYSLQTIPQITI